MGDSEGDIWANLHVVVPAALAPHFEEMAEQYNFKVHVSRRVPRIGKAERQFLQAKKRRQRYHVEVRDKNRNMNQIMYWHRLLEGTQ
jgi:hypothetical protein